jgi:PAS domain S-box-containing protein/diguanylate cyclase (GGDEF)-like protein
VSKQLKLIVVEDIEADAKLLARQLSKAGHDCAIRRVQTEAELLDALREMAPDLILSDFSLPRFNGLRALEIAVQNAPDTPFIFVSGTIGEERAIDALRSGATDYVLKSNLSRLAPAVDRALREAALRRERRQSEQQLRATVETSQDWIWEVDIEGRLRFCSGAVADILGYEPAELIGQDFRSLLHDREEATADSLLPSPEQPRLTGSVARWRTANGEIRWLERNVVAITDESGRRVGFRGADRDITARREQEERLRRLTRTYRMLSSTSSAILRLRSRADLLDEVCRIAVDQGGYDCVSIALTDPGTKSLRLHATAGTDVADPSAMENLPAPAEHDRLQQVMRSGAPLIINDLTLESEGPLGNSSAQLDEYRALAALPLLVDGTAVGVMTLLSADREVFDEAEIGVLLELTANLGYALQYLEKDEAVHFLSYFDSLTGLAKRPLFCERLAGAISLNEADVQSQMVIAFDVQKLGAINDSFGRYIGDRLIERIAARLKQSHDDTEHLAYLGGGTFVALLSNSGKLDSTAQISQNAISRLFTEPFHIDGQEFRVAMRYGIAFHPQDAESADALVQNAETALKAAREDNEKSMPYALVTQRPTTRSVALEARLAGALDRDEFLLHYQPKVMLATGRISGFEALLRWRDKQDGLVPPALFIPLLERSGAIIEVGEWVLLKAMADVRAWHAAGVEAVRVAVNVSPMQLRRRDFVDRILRGVDASLAHPAEVDIEITESMLMQDIELSIGKLAQLREAGVGVAIDDFGTGYSSLRLLARLPVDVLKIDRSFVQSAFEAPSNVTLISTIVSLARSFHMQTVAEGVETMEQAHFLRQIDCDQAQGYLFARPAPAMEVPSMIAHLTLPIALAEPGWDRDDPATVGQAG